MSYKLAWKGMLSTVTSKDSPASATSLGSEKKAAKTEQDLCKEIFNLGDMLACYIFSEDGRILGTNFGEMQVDDELKESFGQIAAVVWGGLRRVEVLGGPIHLVSVDYRDFKIIGIPFPLLKIGVLATVPVSLDSQYLRERIREFVVYWSQANELRLDAKNRQS